MNVIRIRQTDGWGNRIMDEIAKAIKEHIDNDHAKFTIQIWITILGAFAVIAGQWYVTQYRVDEFQREMKEIGRRVDDNKQAIVAHIQWEMQHEISAKDKEIKMLREKLREMK